MVRLLKNRVTNTKCVNQPQSTWAIDQSVNITLLDSGKYKYTLPAGTQKGGISLATFNDLAGERIIVFSVLESIDKTVNNGFWIEATDVVEQFDEHTIAVKTSDDRYAWEPFLYVPSTGYTLDWVCSYTPEDYRTLRGIGLTHFFYDTRPE